MFPGITIEWDKGMRVYITLEPTYMGRVCGLCGDFDGKAENDFRARSELVERTALPFANSWKTQSTCPAQVKESTNPCTLHPERKYWATFSCNILHSPVFDPCHSVVSVMQYYDACVWDSCGCNRGGDCECLCTAVSAYVRQCNIEGVPIKWRAQSHCRTYTSIV